MKNVQNLKNDMKSNNTDLENPLPKTQRNQDKSININLCFFLNRF